MKKIFTALTIIAIIGITNFSVVAQDTIVQWTFPTNSALADQAAIPANLTQEIETAGGTSAIQFKNGLTTKAAQATGWDNGANAKKWTVEFETTGYTNIKLSSIITSGGADPGPRDFKIQYKLDGGLWIDIDNSEFQTANNWTTGAINDLPIPAACDDQINIKIRWIMTTDTATNGEIVTASGKSKIDNIYMTGNLISGTDETSLNNVDIYPNPANDFIVVHSQKPTIISIYNINGQQVINTISGNNKKIDVSRLTPGSYMIKTENTANKSVILQKIIIN